MQLVARVALVTGGTGGLGSRICHALAAAGCHVVVAYRASHDRAAALASELATYHGRPGLPLAADLADAEALPGLLAAIERQHGRLDILINNAAANRWVPFTDLDALTPDLWGDLLHRNLTSPFLLSRAAAPLLRRHQQGRIVNVSSLAGFTPSGSSIAYAVSKAGLNHLTRCLAVALAPDVLVNGVAPGLMEGTRMTDALEPAYVERVRAGAALKRAAAKEDVAAQIVAFCQTDSITGQTLLIDAGRFYH
jgi:3-oxoacyl-[acyl-carrier protein] reductase